MNDYCDYLKDNVRYEIVSVGIEKSLVLPDDLMYPNEMVEYHVLKPQIEALFKNHLRILGAKGETLSCFNRTSIDGNACVLEHVIARNTFEYLVIYWVSFYEDSKQCKITITSVERNLFKFPCCN